MKKLFLLILLAIAPCLKAQYPWSGVLAPTYGAGACTLLAAGTYAGCGVDWGQVGIPGGIPSPSWTQSGSTITATSGDRTATIQAALDVCGTNHFVLLGVGSFQINGHLVVHSNCALRGSGASQTILNALGTGGGVVSLGSSTAFPDATKAVAITAGATAGSTSVTLSNASLFSAGQTMPISELNLYPYVNLSGGPGGGNCTFCSVVFAWGPINGVTRARGQIVHINSVVGNVVNFDPPLYTSYLHNLPTWTSVTKFTYASVITNGGHYYVQINNNASPYTCTSGGSAPAFSTSGAAVSDGSGASTCLWQDEGVGTTTQPQAIPFTPSATFAGVENLQIFANNTGYDQAVAMSGSAYSWISGIETNYIDGDISDVSNGFRNEIRDSYFSNSYGHSPGTHDSCVLLKSGTSGTLIINDIFERLHVAVLMETGASGNVYAYNFSYGNFDTGSPNAIYGTFGLHAAQPQFNLAEGNVMITMGNDSTWGGSWQGTYFRNWILGTTKICNPTNSTRGTINCTPTGTPSGAGINGWQGFQIARTESYDYASWYFNTIGNVLGSSQMQALVNTGPFPLGQTNIAAFPATRRYDSVAYIYSFGYSGASDGDGSFFASDSTVTQPTILIHGDYSNITNAVQWQTPITHTLPSSFFLASKPAWWGTLPYPAIGPDVSGGTGPGGHVSNITAANPAQNCYYNFMGGTDGGAGSPKTFDPLACYPTSPIPPSPPTNIQIFVIAQSSR